ncbi:MAG TPA: hypothetical protein VN363_05810 [Anaerolineales bacterium]|nr:hypothetical protein [Anaerolineales bacterium]
MTNLWVIASAIFLAVALMGIIAFILWYSRPVAETPGSVTAVLNVLPAPTSTPLPATPTSPPPATSTLPAPPEGVIALGGTVQISGTGGDGLRLRQAPGLEQPMRLLGAEDEIFTVTDGPQESDGYVWWYIEGLYDATRSGWAVANYLEGNQGP